MVLAAAGVGVLVGLTGAGGGALMTPVLMLLFGVPPVAAISSDIVATLIMRPFGAAVHARRGNVAWRIVAWLAAGSVPAAFAGAYLLHLLGADTVALERALGVALLGGAVAMAARRLLPLRERSSPHARLAASASPTGPPPALQPQASLAPRRSSTLAVGAAGGLMVGATSVGAGSLMVVLLTFVYPSISAGQLVATDLAQAIPLSAAAAGGAALFGHVQLSVTLSVAAGGVPGVLVGSALSSRAPDALLRPAVACAVLACGLKYVGFPPAWILAGTAFAVVLAVVSTAGRRSRRPGPLRSPDATRSSPDATRSSPDATRSSPDATRSSPDMTRSSPDMTRSSPDVTRPSPDALAR
jgi:uncharacterized membrane protein YfcA